MNQPNAGRKIAHIISRNSNWTSNGVIRFYKANGVYARKVKWISFLKIFLLASGMAFCAAGIFFFFAYNWSAMHPFAKLGIAQGLVTIPALLAVFLKSQVFVKRILLTASSLMTGVLFAVFGQIYQTGADTYDFFLAWSLFIAIWVVVADFAPLWLIFVILINTTVFFFFEQDVRVWIENARMNIHFAINMFFVLMFLWSGQMKILKNKPGWLIQIIALCAITSLTLSVIFGIYGHQNIHFPIAIVCLLVFFTLAILYGLRSRSFFWLSTIGFSLIAIICALIIKPFDDLELSFLFVSVFIIGSTSLLIYQLLQLKKRWFNEN